MVWDKGHHCHQLLSHHGDAAMLCPRTPQHPFQSVPMSPCSLPGIPVPVLLSLPSVPTCHPHCPSSLSTGTKATSDVLYLGPQLRYSRLVSGDTRRCHLSLVSPLLGVTPWSVSLLFGVIPCSWDHPCPGVPPTQCHSPVCVPLGPASLLSFGVPTAQSTVSPASVKPPDQTPCPRCRPRPRVPPPCSGVSSARRPLCPQGKCTASPGAVNSPGPVLCVPLPECRSCSRPLLAPVSPHSGSPPGTPIPRVPLVRFPSLSRSHSHSRSWSLSRISSPIPGSGFPVPVPIPGRNPGPGSCPYCQSQSRIPCPIHSPCPHSRSLCLCPFPVPAPISRPLSPDTAAVAPALT